VLKNSGDLLHELGQHKFDLVLHGHKHKPQFARLELSPDGADPYPLMVIAGGSTAKNDVDPADNTLRLIKTEANGLLTVETIEHGQPNDDEEIIYREEIAKLKQRAFSRARERTKRVCSHLHQEVAIDSNGNVSNVIRIEQLRLLRGAEPVEGLPLRLVVPRYAPHFDDLIQISDDSRDIIKEVCWRDRAGDVHSLNKIPVDRDGGYYWIKFNERLAPGRSLQPFSIRYPQSNIIAMSSWELAERARLDPNQDRHNESVWRYVSHPADRLTMRLKFPSELEDVQINLRCRRHPNYPDFPLTFLPDRVDLNEGSFVVDADVQSEEAPKLKYEAVEKAWLLNIDYPTPGYIYELTWRVPDIAADSSVAGPTKDYQRMLLELRERISQGNLSESDHDSLNSFKKSALALVKQFESKYSGERQAVLLMVYDERDLHLVPVLSFDSEHKDNPMPGTLKIPLGAGVSGAAFLQRRLVAWGKSPDSRSLISPIPLLPGFDAQYILAVPIFYQHEKDAQQRIHLDFRPGAVIGVVTLASNASGSRIENCRGEEEEPKALRNTTQMVAQTMVSELLEFLTNRRV
jgi:hypothetical protein